MRDRWPHRILVTGVGGAPGFDLARELLQHGREVIAADADPLAAGLSLPAVAPVVLPAADDPGYVDALLEACRDHRVEAVLPGIEPELPRLVEAAEQLHVLGVRTWLPAPEAIACCGDKAAFAERLSAAGIDTPVTWLPHQVPPDAGHVVVKPRRGHGSQGVHVGATVRQARVLCDLVSDPIVQQVVTGAEFTADCVTAAGRTSVILRRRLLVKGGMSLVGETFHHPAAAEQVRAALTAVGVDAGVCCAQGFITADEQVLMTEVNLRIAGAHSISVMAGADLIGQLLNGLAGLPVDHRRLTYQTIRVTRYVETLGTAIHNTAAPGTEGGSVSHPRPPALSGS